MSGQQQNPSIGDGPIQLPENGMVIIPGISEPVPVKNLIGTQSKFTQVMQQLAEQRRQLTAAEEEAQEGLAVLQALNQDPFGTLKKLQDNVMKWAQETGAPIPDSLQGKPIPGMGTPPAGNSSGQGQQPNQQEQLPPAFNSFRDEIKEELASLRSLQAEIQELRSGFTSFAARLDTTSQMERLTQANPELMQDTNFRAKMAEVIGRAPNLTLEDAFRLAAHERTTSRVKELEEELKAAKRASLLASPELGFGASSSGAPPSDVDEDKTLERIFNEKLDGLLQQ